MWGRGLGAGASAGASRALALLQQLAVCAPDAAPLDCASDTTFIARGGGAFATRRAVRAGSFQRNYVALFARPADHSTTNLRRLRALPANQSGLWRRYEAPPRLWDGWGLGAGTGGAAGGLRQCQCSGSSGR